MFAAGPRVFTHTLVRGLLVALALLAAGAAQALSIGEISVHSRLGEPLRAVVALGNLGSLVADEILVGHASDEAYRSYGVDRAAYGSPLKFELQVDEKGRASVAVTTARPLSEPYIDLVLEVRWPTGRTVRQFTVLLDPPAR